MCLIAFAWRSHPGLSLVLASNRDEAFDRATAPVDWWDDAPDVLAGRDLEASGTWMGVTRHGRFAALTNYRAPNEKNPEAPSRGALVANYLTGTTTPADYLGELAPRARPYNGFSLLTGDVRSQELWLYSNRSGQAPQPLPPGVYGLSNALLDTPWPKLLATRDFLRLALDENSPDLDSHLFNALANPEVAPEYALPATGVDSDLEKRLSAAFILPAVRVAGGAPYGTRSSTVLTVAEEGKVRYRERSFDERGDHRERSFEFNLVVRKQSGATGTPAAPA